jgi:hypothetical protein
MSSSLPLETQVPSGPRQPEPPLQPQPLQRQAASANAVGEPGSAKNDNEINTMMEVARARMSILPL